MGIAVVVTLSALGLSHFGFHLLWWQTALVGLFALLVVAGPVETVARSGIRKSLERQMEGLNGGMEELYESVGDALEWDGSIALEVIDPKRFQRERNDGTLKGRKAAAAKAPPRYRGMDVSQGILDEIAERSRRPAKRGLIAAAVGILVGLTAGALASRLAGWRGAGIVFAGAMAGATTWGILAWVLVGMPHRRSLRRFAAARGIDPKLVFEMSYRLAAHSDVTGSTSERWVCARCGKDLADADFGSSKCPQCGLNRAGWRARSPVKRWGLFVAFLLCMAILAYVWMSDLKNGIASVYIPLAAIGGFLMLAYQVNKKFVRCQDCSWMGSPIDIEYWRGHCPVCGNTLFMYAELLSEHQSDHKWVSTIRYRVTTTTRFAVRRDKDIKELRSEETKIWRTPPVNWWRAGAS